MTSDQIIKALPWEMAARLQSNCYFHDIPVVVAEEGNIKLTMAQKQGVITARKGKRGIAVIVLQLVLDDEFPNLQFGPITFKPAIQIVENLELNRDANGTGKSARQVGRKIRDVFKGSYFGGLTKVWKAATGYLIPVALSAELGKNTRAYQANFECLEDSDEPVSQVSAPTVISQAPAPQVALACATAGAQLWFTTDDTYPADPHQWPGSTAQLYAGPIAIDVAGTVIRAVAVAPPMIDSSCIRASCVATPL